ncbi:hypothetical protein ACWPKO_25980 (plasmid) [Coraliomargarita sp. W4R53]
MSSSRGGQGGSIPPAAALALTTISFVALLIFGFGMTSLLLDEDVISVPGLGQIPGVVAVLASMGAFALTLWIGIRDVAPTYWRAVWTAVAAFVAYVVALWASAVLASSDVAVATSAASDWSTSWFGVVVLAAGAVCGWSGVALVRTRAARPEWPWEREDDQ